MPLRQVVAYPHPALLQPTQDVVRVDDDLRQLVADMIETMYAAQGIGLAANQVADGRRVTVIDLSSGEDPAQLRVLINGKVLEQSGSQTDEEGCLSFPGIYEKIVRPRTITYRAYDLELQLIEAQAEGLLARCICHELDHLDGRTFLSRMSPLKRRFVLRHIDQLRESGEWPLSAAQ